jgi:hypothetical protein
VRRWSAHAACGGWPGGRLGEAGLCGLGIRPPATTIIRVGGHGWANIHGTGLTFGIACPGQMRAAA